MIRNPSQLKDKVFDLLIIGGGIQGAALAWRASLAGFTVAVIEQNDFGSGTSSSSQKIIHGGLRYLQSFDIKRIYQSVSERRRMMWLAPHLVKPLPFLMPIYGHGFKGKESMYAGMILYNLLSLNRNNIPDEEKYIPDARIINKKEILSVLPDLPEENLQGAAFWYDAFCTNTERLILSLLKSAMRYGAVAVNYIKATNLIKTQNKVLGADVFDKISKNFASIHARYTVNCTGSWIKELMLDPAEENSFTAGINLVIKKDLPFKYGTGINDPVSKRMYVVVPWRDKFIIGTEWIPVSDPKNFSVSNQLIEKLLNAFNRAYPAAELCTDDISFIHKGFVPAKKENSTDTLSHFRITNGSEHGYSGYFSIAAVKYTTAINVAEDLLKKIFNFRIDIPLIKQPKLIGGEINSVSQFSKDIIQKWNRLYPIPILNKLVSEYGSEVEDILTLARNELRSTDHSFARELLKAQVLFAIREEMALSLEDIILRRTAIGSHENPPADMVYFIADIAAVELNWTNKKKTEELNKLGYMITSEYKITEWSH